MAEALFTTDRSGAPVRNLAREARREAGGGWIVSLLPSLRLSDGAPCEAAAVAAGPTAASAFRAGPVTPEVLGACGPRCDGEVTVTSVRVTTVELEGPVHDLESRGTVLRCPICGRGLRPREWEAASIDIRWPCHHTHRTAP